MERLWAPWRMEYILQPKPGDCFICEAVSRPERDAENLVLVRNDSAIVMMNRFPYNNGHLLVAPCQHGISYEELPEEAALQIHRLSGMMIGILKQVMNPDAFNLGYNLGKTAGAGLLDHLHLHVVPRWNGDTNFMPVLDQTRVISEALASTYYKIKQAIP